MTDRHLIGSSATPSEPINWLRARGYHAASFGVDGFGTHQGIVFSRDIPGPDENHTALVGQWLVWDGENVTIEDA